MWMPRENRSTRGKHTVREKRKSWLPVWRALNTLNRIITIKDIDDANQSKSNHIPRALSAFCCGWAHAGEYVNTFMMPIHIHQWSTSIPCHSFSIGIHCVQRIPWHCIALHCTARAHRCFDVLQRLPFFSFCLSCVCCLQQCQWLNCHAYCPFAFNRILAYLIDAKTIMPFVLRPKNAHFWNHVPDFASIPFNVQRHTYTWLCYCAPIAYSVCTVSHTPFPCIFVRFVSRRLSFWVVLFSSVRSHSY